MKYKEDEIIKKYFDKIESDMDGFFKLFSFFIPKWFKFLNYLMITSIFWYIAEITGNNLLYIIAFISILLILMLILGFIDTINYLIFKSRIISQLIGFILFVLPLFLLSIIIIILIVKALTFQFS